MSSTEKPKGWRRVVRNLRRIPQDLAKPYRKWQRKRLIERIPALPQPSAEKSILFLAPEAGVAPHHANMGFLARTMQEQGHSVLMARCFNLFPRCPVMGAHQLGFEATQEERLKACRSCIGFSIDFANHFQTPALDLRSLDFDKAESICQNELANAPRDLSKFEYEGVAFGRLSTIDLVLATKKHLLHDVDDATRAKWLKLIHSSLKMYLLIDELCAKFPLSTIVHHNDYSLLLGGRIAAAKHGVNVQGITLAYHKNIDQGRVVIYPTYWPIYNKQVAEAWSDWRDEPLLAEQVKEVVDDLVVRTSGAGSHIYSAARGKASAVQEQLGLDPHKRLLVAYTSSLDEYVAGKMLMQSVGFEANDDAQPFVDQIHWLRELVDYVGRREDLQLVVRVHPREGSNHRESTVSEHLPLLEAEFGSLPENCRFIWPSDRTSSYDLGEAADIVLTSWSTIGIEMARFGAPVLASFKIAEAPYPTDDFLMWEPSRDAYFARIESVLNDSPTLERWKHALRWYQYANLSVSVDVGDTAGPLVMGKPKPYAKPKNAALVEDAILGRKVVTDLNLDRQRAIPFEQRADSESVGIVRQLSRLIHYLVTGQDSTPSIQIRLGEASAFPADLQSFATRLHGTEKTAKPQAGPNAVLSIRGPRVTYHVLGLDESHDDATSLTGITMLQSPMVARLGQLLHEASMNVVRTHRQVA